MQSVLAVDFGTSTSSAALVHGGEVRLVQEPGQDSWSWPSSVCLSGEVLLVGRAAENLKRVRPRNYRTEFKRDLGQRAPIWLGERSFLPEELVAAMLRALRDQASRSAGGREIQRLVLTVPASYVDMDPRRELMITAGELAGFTDVELLPEPVAAAFAPIAGPAMAPGDLMLVYDFGGGTFDTALLRVLTDGTCEVLGCAALEDCGGSDIDSALYQWLNQVHHDELVQLATPGDAAMHVKMALGDLVHGAKHQLTEASTSQNFFGPLRRQLMIDRQRLEEVVAPLLHRTVRCCRDLLAGARVSPERVAAVLLVGGSSRIPLVSRVLTAELGRPLRLVEDPSVAVVHGAARWAATGVHTLGLRQVEPGRRPLRWRVPGGKATLVRWLVEPGQWFEPGTALAVVRLDSGALWRLNADDRPGQLITGHAQPGSEVGSADWIATVTTGSAQ